ncbi:MAG: hypothetical protein QOG11_955, partial [Solirubrobacteraceae bacterium]|nr:hypothetical protein [Solirubrobacteraceae bacterium]
MAWLHRARAGAQLRELPLVAALAAALVIDSSLDEHAHSMSVAGGLAVALVTLPLLWRSTAPVVVLVAVVAGVFGCLLTLKPVEVIALPAMVAAYSVAVRGHRALSVVLAAAVVGVVVLAVGLFSPQGLISGYSVSNSAYLLLAVVAGDAVRTKRAYRAAARRREREREQEAEHEAQRRVAEERVRIAREVHDVVAHALVAINVQAGVAAHLLDERAGRARTALTEIKSVSGAALTDLRATLGLLREAASTAPVSPTERLSQVPDLAGPLRAAGIDVSVDVSGPEDRVASPVGAAAYRIVQEALTNVLRHAGARRAEVRV